MGMATRWWLVVVLLAIVAADVSAQPRARQATVAHPHLEAVSQKTDAILDELKQTGDFESARRASDAVLDRLIAYADANDFEAFREIAYVRRLVRQLEQVTDVDRLEMLAYLRSKPRLGRAVAFAVKPENDVAAVYRLLDELREARGDKLETFAYLAAAIVVVHDRPMVTQVNENTTSSPEPIELFDFYAGNHERMKFGIRDMPVELLVYLVDIGATIDEMQWALDEYRGHRNVGRLFHTIRYDQNHFRRGTPKRVTTEGFNLPNIRAFGGVCADQAHFAVTVGKAIGVPAVYASGASSQVSHAWVGFLEQQGQSGVWNFDHGRYAAYQGVRGLTRDPQTRQWVDDSYVSLLAELIGTNETQRYSAAAMTDATIRLHAISQADLDHWDPEPLITFEAGDDDDAAAPPSPRGRDLASQLELLEAGLRESHGHLYGWLMLAHMAESGQMTLDQKRRWADVVMRLCGQRYPDFAVVLLRPMVETVTDLHEQDALWEQMFQMFRRRHDLAAEIRMRQGEMWEQAGEFIKAGQRYENVIERYANAGPFVLEAVRRTQRMLEQAGRGERVLELYAHTWSQVNRPADMYLEFQQQSNWYRLGMMYVEQLQQAGETREAQRALAQIEQRVGR
ncbi:hypothetical protein ACERK3_13180 [Phycisphaerales bacterium AB-hyl4]|uniref:Transglutaminase superfamily protein n=1 Tax=Natronomicrosphaera hydrolytica TaxID=3242702 RepID=A0ABV4U6L9_9BACT